MFGRQVQSLERLRGDLPDRVVDALVELLGHNESVLHHEGAIVLNRGARPDADRAEYGEFYLGGTAQAIYEGQALGVKKWCKTIEPWMWWVNPNTNRTEYMVKCRECSDITGLTTTGTEYTVYLQVTGDNVPSLDVGDTMIYAYDRLGRRIAVPSVRSLGVSYSSTSVSSEASRSSSLFSSVWSSDSGFVPSSSSSSWSDLPHTSDGTTGDNPSYSFSNIIIFPPVTPDSSSSSTTDPPGPPDTPDGPFPDPIDPPYWPSGSPRPSSYRPPWKYSMSSWSYSSGWNSSLSQWADTGLGGGWGGGWGGGFATLDEFRLAMQLEDADGDLLPRKDARVLELLDVCKACPNYTGTACRLSPSSGKDFHYFLRIGQCEANRW